MISSHRFFIFECQKKLSDTFDVYIWTDFPFCWWGLVFGIQVFLSLSDKVAYCTWKSPDFRDIQVVNSARDDSFLRNPND